MTQPATSASGYDLTPMSDQEKRARAANLSAEERRFLEHASKQLRKEQSS